MILTKWMRQAYSIEDWLLKPFNYPQTNATRDNFSK